MNWTLVRTVGLLVAYGLLRLSTSLFTELRELVFAKVSFGASRQIALQVFEHMHALSLRFHLERQTGAIARDLQRGSQSLSTLLNYLVFSILPALVELALVCIVLFVNYAPAFGGIILASIAVYVGFTLAVTHWRIEHRHDRGFRHDFQRAAGVTDAVALPLQIARHAGDDDARVSRRGFGLRDECLDPFAQGDEVDVFRGAHRVLSSARGLAGRLDAARARRRSAFAVLHRSAATACRAASGSKPSPG